MNLCPFLCNLRRLGRRHGMTVKKERAVPWNPIPKYANRYMDLVVMHFEQRSAVEGSPVSLLVAFSHDSDDAEAGVSEETWWRIIFRHVPAFRFRHLDNAPASPPFVRPRPGEPLDVAIWEVVH